MRGPTPFIKRMLTTSARAQRIVCAQSKSQETKLPKKKKKVQYAEEKHGGHRKLG